MDDRLDPSSGGRFGAPRRRTVGSLGRAALVISVSFAACGGDDDSDDRPGTASRDGAPLFAARCASCHGSDLRGTDVGPSLLSQIYEPSHHPDDSFRAAIQDGVTPHHWHFGPMPAIAGLDDAEITAIITHIREVQEREGFEPYPPE
jgi:mono/diheme cytochrome c family protein